MLIIIVILLEWRGVIPNHTCSVLDHKSTTITSLLKRKDSPLDSLLFFLVFTDHENNFVNKTSNLDVKGIFEACHK